MSPIFAQAADPSVWPYTTIVGTLIAATAAGIGFGGKWFLGLVSKLVDGQASTITAAAVEINASSELRRMDMEQLERIAKAWESAIAKQAKRDELWAKAQTNCAELREEHRKHFDAELERLQRREN